MELPAGNYDMYIALAERPKDKNFRQQQRRRCSFNRSACQS
jgi:hypothetical protein